MSRYCEFCEDGGDVVRGSIQGALAGVISALLVAFLLMPVSGVDTDPPVCSSVLGYSVPCGPGWGLGVTAVVGLLAGWAVFRLGR